MFDSIIVGWDGSAESQTAAEWAAAYAGSAQVTLLHALGDRATGSDYLAATGERSSQRVRLMEVADRLRAAHPGVRFETETEHGAAVDALGARLRADALVVVGAPAGGIASNWTLGARLAGRSGGRAVAVIPAAASPRAPASIVVGVDGTPAARAALRVAVAESARLGCALTLVHAWDIPIGWSHGLDEYPTATDIDALERVHRGLLDDALEAARADGAHAEGRLEMGRAAEVLSRSADASTLLVVASHGKGGLARFFLGSTSHALIVRGGSPRLVVGE